jgi:general secretion pathway protein A
MYEEYFGLEDEPFRLTADPRYLFLSSKHAEALAHLRLGLTESSGFVCITGEVGSGKTTLLRAFLAEQGPNVAAACIYIPPLSGLDLVRRICREFGLATAGENLSDLVDQLHRHLLAQHAAGRTCVLVLDEAQALSVGLLEQVRLLLNLETETQKLLRIVLVGQPQLRALLLDRNLKQLNQRITLRWHLGPLSRRETIAYVAHRLAVASGGRAKALFTRPALGLLYGVAEGVPRVVNMVAHRAMLAAFLARATRVRRRDVARAYREIQSVPLPGTLSAARKAGWAAAGLAAGILLFTYGAAPLARFFSVRQDSPSVPRQVDREPESAPQAAAPAAWQPDLNPVAAQAAATKSSIAAGAKPVPVSVASDLQRRVSSAGVEKGARQAADALLAAWGMGPLADDDLRFPDDLDVAAWRSGLHELVLTGNRSMLRLLDLPALVALGASNAADARYAALLGMDSSRVELSVAGEKVIVDAATFEQLWSGEARVLWRDYDRLGGLLQRGARGVAVVRLQKLLRDAGSFDLKESGRFEGATEAAVRNFQRARLLDPDGLVGPFTQIALYAAAGRRSRPSLAIDGQAGS